MARKAGRQHIAQRLERRFAPLFWLARPRPSWSEPGLVWDVADELDQLLARAGFSPRGFDPTRAERAREKQNPYRRNSRLAARWELPDNPVTKSIAAQWASSDDPMTRLKPAAAKLAWLVNSVGELVVGFRKDTMEQVSLLEALGTADRRRRRDLLRWVVSRRGLFTATAVVDGPRVELRPDPRDLHTCIWVLAAELLAGGWPVRRCAAPKCGRYFGQWTKRGRLFCDDGCRTAYHNAQRARLGPANVPANVPATASTEP